jgi:hypothetical protein
MISQACSALATGAGVVLGKAEYGAGALGAFGHVVALQDAVAVVVAVVADGGSRR